jgi:hypothetical protein
MDLENIQTEDNQPHNQSNLQQPVNDRPDNPIERELRLAARILSSPEMYYPRWPPTSPHNEDKKEK